LNEKLGVGIFNEISEYVVKATRLLKTYGWHHTCNIVLGECSDIHANIKELRHKV
jgi:hypothetical protein